MTIGTHCVNAQGNHVENVMNIVRTSLEHGNRKTRHDGNLLGNM